MRANIQPFTYKSFQIYLFDELESTNGYLKDGAANSNEIVDNTIIWALSQTKGKGQNNNMWFSEPKQNLTFSLYINHERYASIPPFIINKWISISLVQFLDDVGDNFFIKWPNDLYYKNKKIGGILIENAWSGNHFKHSIIGIGININQSDFSNNKLNATSLNIIYSKKYELINMLQIILDKIANNQAYLSNPGVLDKHYFRYLLGFKKWRHYKNNQTNEMFRGYIEDITSKGALLIRTQHSTLSFSNKEIEFIFD